MALSRIDKLSINTIRTLCIDAVQKAKSGHPGAPMSLAPAAYFLWQKFLSYDPADPIWPNRDRFVLSNGHASMLLYSLLHLTGVSQKSSKHEKVLRPAITISDIKNFRQLKSKCPGHPEYGISSGVEATTGPLGQGVASSVGMAMAQKWKASRYNKSFFKLFDYNIYAFCGDGCLMEGVASEAASLAGHLALGNLLWLYDNNHITIEGKTSLAFSEDVEKRFKSYGWRVARVHDANDRSALERVYKFFLMRKDKPLLIISDSEIGYGSPNKQNTASAHGEPLGEEEVRLAKEFYGWPKDDKFVVPSEVIDNFKNGFERRGKKLNQEWQKLFESYQHKHPKLAQEILQMEDAALPNDWDLGIPKFEPDKKGIAGREASHRVLNAVAKRVPWILGGSADLAPSTKTLLTFEGEKSFSRNRYGGRNLHFGIRESAMASILNGLALSKLRPYGSTFLTFSDYAKPGIRLSALMELPVIYIFTHDSIGLGEDGPTHQPVEHLSSLRSIPGLITLRPADANEVAECWRIIMSSNHEPAALVLSRQSLPTFDRKNMASKKGVLHGAYVLLEERENSPQVILLASGSEVHLCIDAFYELKKKGVSARVVSMPSWEIFERQSQSYKESVLPKVLNARVAVEQASAMGWERYVGTEGAIIAMNTFGKSAPLKELQKEFGFTPEKIVDSAIKQVARFQKG